VRRGGVRVRVHGFASLFSSQSSTHTRARARATLPPTPSTPTHQVRKLGTSAGYWYDECVLAPATANDVQRLLNRRRNGDDFLLLHPGRGACTPSGGPVAGG
jgi:hypothetical protein